MPYPKETTQKKFDTLFSQFVPRSGSCTTLGGEVLRAVGKIGYRFYNDGDMSREEYGKETVNYAVRFLVNVCKTLAEQGQRLPRFENATTALYERQPYSDTPESYNEKFNELADSALEFIEVFGLCEKPNEIGDMLDFYVPEEDDDPDPDEDEDFDYDEWERENCESDEDEE